MKQVLFVCSGNTCRSPMAQLMLENMLACAGKPVSVESAGIMARDGMPVSHGAQSALGRRGIDASAKLSQQADGRLVDKADLILTMTASHRDALRRMFPGAADKTYTLAEYTSSLRDVADPYGGDDADYERCAKQIEEMLLKLKDKL